MSDKSYVTLAICPICKNETGELLLDRRLRPQFEMHTIIPYSVCDNCKKTYLSKGVMLIDPKTGSLCVLRDVAFRGLFHKKIPKNKIVYCSQEVLDKINELNKSHQNN